MSLDSVARSLFWISRVPVCAVFGFAVFLSVSKVPGWFRFLLSVFLHRQQFDSSWLSWIYNGFIMESSWIYHGFMLESEVCRDRFEEPRLRGNQGKEKPKAVFPRQPFRNRGEINYLVNNPPYPTHIRGL